MTYSFSSLSAIYCNCGVNVSDKLLRTLRERDPLKGYRNEQNVSTEIDLISLHRRNTKVLVGG